MQIQIHPADYSPAKSWRSAAFSLITHLLILGLILVWFSFGTSRGTVEQIRTGQIVLAEINEDQTQYLSEDEVANDDASEPSAMAAASQAPPPMPNLDVPDLEMAGVVSIDSTIDVNAMATEDTNSADFEYKFSEADLRTIDADRKHFEAVKAAGPPTTINIFGSGNLTGRKFVFLIDRSKSMGEQGLRVLRNATSELVSGINQLEENHYFQIIAYNDRVTSMKMRRLLPATDENKRLVPPFMTNLLAYGGTNHVSAIYSALSFDPDVILILNDGGFPELNGGQIAELGRHCHGTQIHALHFGLGPSLTENHFMRQLAETCSGSYRYIDVRNWQKDRANKNP